MKKAKRLRELSTNQILTEEQIIEVLSDISKQPKQSSPPSVKVKYQIYSKYFSADTGHDEIETIIDRALHEYFQEND